METNNAQTSYVTVEVGEQTIGIAISRVREVFTPDRLTQVPLSPPEIAGVLNLRGRIVSAIEMRTRLGLPRRPAGAPLMAIGIDFKSEAFALLVDRVGDVMDLSDADRESPPATLDPRWVELTNGVHRLHDRLLLVLDVDRTLEPPTTAAAA